MLFILISWATWSSHEVIKRKETMRIILGIDRLSRDTEMYLSENIDKINITLYALDEEKTDMR
jgi:hypothetical protein